MKILWAAFNPGEIPAPDLLSEQLKTEPCNWRTKEDLPSRIPTRHLLRRGGAGMVGEGVGVRLGLREGLVGW